MLQQVSSYDIYFFIHYIYVWLFLAHYLKEHQFYRFKLARNESLELFFFKMFLLCEFWQLQHLMIWIASSATCRWKKCRPIFWRCLGKINSASIWGGILWKTLFRPRPSPCRRGIFVPLPPYSSPTESWRWTGKEKSDIFSWIFRMESFWSLPRKKRLFSHLDCSSLRVICLLVEGIEKLLILWKHWGKESWKGLLSIERRVEWLTWFWATFLSWFWGGKMGREQRVMEKSFYW